MTDADIKAALADRSALALTIWGEARSEALDVQAAVGCVIRNRAKQPAQYDAVQPTVAGVCLAPKQFSCWNGGDGNSASVMAQAERLLMGLPVTDLYLSQALWLADGLLSGAVLDLTAGATFYLETSLYQSEHPPLWSRHVRRVLELGPFTFLRPPTPSAVM